MELTVFESEGLPLTLWNAIQDCNEDCPIHESCPYTKKEKCVLRERYIKSVMTSVDAGIKNRDEIVNLKIGLMLIPLFNQLVTFKIRAFATQTDVFISSKKIQVNPVFKEIRDIIKDINSLMKDLNVNSEIESRSLLNGDSDYYDKMISTGKVPS